MILSLVLVFSIIYGYLFFKQPKLGLQILLFSLPAYLIRFKFFIPFTLLEVMILLSFSLWLVRNYTLVLQGIKNRGQFKKIVIEYPFASQMVGVVAVGFVGVIVAGLSNDAMGTWKAYFFEPLLLVILLYQIIVRQEKKLINIFWSIIEPLAYSAILVSMLAVYQKITGNLIFNPLWSAVGTRRVVSVFGFPNAVGLFLETIVIYSTGYYFLTMKDAGWRKQVFLLMASALSLLSIGFAKSMGAGLGLFAAAFFFAIFYSRTSRRVAATIFLILTIVGLSLPAGRNKIFKYITLSDFSGQVRILQWQETWKMLSDGRIFTGAGLSQYQEMVKPYHADGFFYNKDNDPDFRRKIVIYDQKYKAKYWQPLEIYMYPHNILLNFWTEVGLLGVLVFFWLIFSFVYLVLRLYKKTSEEERIILLIASAALVAIVVHGLVDVPFFKNDLAILFWLPFVIVGSLDLQRKISTLR